MVPNETRRLLRHALAWAAIAVAHALLFVADAARRGLRIDGGALVMSYLLGYLPWVGLSWWFARHLERRPASLGSAAALARPIGAAVVLFFVPQVVYQAVLTTVMAGRPLSAVAAQLRANPIIYLVTDAMLFVATCAVIAALAVARERSEAEARRRRLDAENQALRLETTRHQLRILQLQLEPHFIFNALNAIGATVRAGDRARALEAIQRLAALLRFAVSASARERITWAEELAFIEDYLALQRLRFGERLVVRVAADDPRLGDRACLPLILQPLVENAIRHALERESGAVAIDVQVSVEAAGIVASVRNPLVGSAADNPGLGAGLLSLRSRLALAYGEDARLETWAEDGQFIARIQLPAGDDE